MTAKKLEGFPFLKKNLLRVDILQTQVVDQSLEVYFKILADWELFKYIFSTESGFPWKCMSVKSLNVGHPRKFPLLKYF